MSDSNITALIFWDQHEAANFAFQEAQVLNIVAEYSIAAYNKLPCRTSSLGGEEYIQELITTAHPRCCQEVFRMPLETYSALEKWLTEHTPLRESRKHFSVQQKLAMFLYIVGEGAFNRAVQEKFQHSGDTVSHVFHEVLNSLMHLHAEIVNLPTKDDALHPRIAEDDKYFPYFQDCLGALDGTHIPAHVPSINGAAYRNRKGVLSQNVLGVCTMDLQFCYVLAGWEGSAHDDRVLEDALFDKNFMIPNKKYYLADAGYHNTDYLLCPYRGVRYHLKEQAMAGQKPTNKEELFNLRHSSLRNVVERIFGVTKRRFQILETPAEFAMVVQVKIVLAITGLHNFIQLHRTTGDIYDKAQLDAERLLMRLSRGEGRDGDIVTHTSANASKGDGARMNRFKDEIAEAMWQDYISY